jgi:hypothetical protein
VLLDCVLDHPLKLGRAAIAVEQDVAARDIGRDIGEPKCLDAGLELGHLDQRPPADVDPSQERDVPHQDNPTHEPALVPTSRRPQGFGRREAGSTDRREEAGDRAVEVGERTRG